MAVERELEQIEAGAVARLQEKKARHIIEKNERFSGGENVKIAISCDGSQVSVHFGRCEKYVLFEEENGKLKSKEIIAHPGHEPFFLPKFLAEKGVCKIICQGVGPRAIALFGQLGIEVIAGITGDVDEVIERYLKRELKTTGSTCEHL